MIFTFYSFKGGVGRSMAVAGIANLLARQGLRVLAVDFDLEAPGLERYFFEAEESRRVREGPGLIDLLMTYKRALTNEAEFEKAEFKRWQNFVTEAIPQAGRGGRVDVMTSGRREPQDRLREYALTVRTFDWQDFFDNWKGESFFDWLRRQLVGPSVGYDVVLVDSRTGVTEMGGICAYQLADVAIMLCAANYQNLEGTVAVANDFRSDAVLALRHGRPLELLVIPARLEDNNPGREEFLERFEELFASAGLPKVLADSGLDYRKLALPYNSEFAVGERLVGEETTSVDGSGTAENVRATQLAATFERLADAMTLLAPPGSPLGKLQDDASRRLTGLVGLAAATLVADPTQGSAGYDVFLDASTEDGIRASELEKRLDQSGFRVFYPRDANSGETELDSSIERALDYSETLLVVFGESTRSAWREQMIQRARARRRTRVVPLLLAKNEWMESALRSFGLELPSAIDLSEWPAATEFERLISLLQGPKRSKLQQAAATERDPYRGARPFSEDEAGIFFGRDVEIEQVMTALSDATRNVVLLVGASGVGKTSLLRAGVLPRVTGQTQVFGQAGTWQTTYIDLSAMEVGHDVAADLNADAQPRLITLDGIDSFPLDGTEDARRKRIASVRAVIAIAAPTRKFVLAGRGAFSTHEWAEMMPDRGPTICPDVALEPLDAKNLREAIERPAGKHGHLLEPGLVARLIDGAGAAHSAIGKIQLVMPTLWEKRRRGWLTNKAYEDVGKLSGVFDEERTRVLQNVDAAFREAARILFRNLMQLNSALQLIPMQRPWSALATIRGVQRPDAVALRDRLAAHGLIDVWREQDQLVCALSRPDAARYIGAETNVPGPEFFLWRTRFALLVQNWTTNNRAEDGLLTGDALDEGEVKLRHYAEELTNDECAFIQASISARRARKEAEREEARLEAERTAKKKARRRARVFAVATTLAVIGTIGSIVLIFYARGQVSQASRASTVALINDQGNSNPTIAVAALHELLGTPQSDRLALASIVRLDDQHVSRGTLSNVGLVLKSNFSPDGHMIVSTSTDKVAWLWDDNGRWVAPLEGHEDLVRDARFSPDGQTILTRSDDRTARLWDREGRWLATFKGHTKPVTQAGYSPDGATIVTSSSDGTARLWDHTGRQRILLKHAGPVASAAFSPDGQTIVTVESGAKPGSASAYDASTSVDKAKLWSREGVLRAVFAGHSGPVSYAGFSSDGKTIVTTSFDRTARLWDQQGKFLVELKGHTAPVTYAEFSQGDETIVTASDDGTARLWDRNGKVLAELRHPAPVAHAAFALDGAVVTASDDGIARLWDRKGKSFSVLKGHTRPVRHAAFSPDGMTIVTSSFDRTARLWDRRGKPLLELNGHAGPVGNAAIDPKVERIVTASEDGTARLWDWQGKQIGNPMAHGGPVIYAVFAPDGQTIVTASYDSTARLWDRQGKFLVQLNGHMGPVSSAAFSPDGGAVLTASADGTARLWDRQGNPVGDPMVHSAPVSFAAFSRDAGIIVTTSFDGKARLWDRNGKLLKALEGHTGPVGYPVFSPDGQTIMTPSFDATARLWDLKGNQLSVLKGHTSPVSYAAFSPDGQTIATASFDGTARLWNRQGETLAQLKGHSDLLWRVDFNPAGDIIVTASDDGTARLWDRHGKVLAELKGHAGPVRYAAFTPDGQWVLTTSTDGSARLWPIDANAFVGRINEIGLPCLSAEERLLFFPTKAAKEALRHAQQCEQQRKVARRN